MNRVRLHQLIRVMSGMGLLLMSVMVCATGCKSLGPRTIPKDRADYSDSIAESWMRQTLLNIVKLRYNTPPVFVDVASVVGGYSFETETGVGFQPQFPGPDWVNINGRLRYTDRPTITYTPMTGGRFMTQLIAPIRPEQVFFTIQAGWNADAIFRAAVATINGLHNRSIAGNEVRPADEKFLRVAWLIEALRESGRVGVRIIQDDQRKTATLLSIHDEQADEKIVAYGKELRQLLRLDPEAREFTLVYGDVAASKTEIAIRSRALVQIMSMMAAEMEVPAEHIAEGRTMKGLPADQKPMMPIRCGAERPTDALVAVTHRGYWFWIDDRDVPAKRMFSFIMLLFTLADNGSEQVLPMITIPAQ